MPMYEYRCDSCNEVFEIIQKFSDEPLKTHEGCGGLVQRLLCVPALQFKGSGWYVTDYARKGNGKSSENQSDTKTGAGTPKAEPAKTESTATKTDNSKS